MVWIWSAVFIVTLVIEIFTVEMVSIWFSVGSFVAFILALCGVGSTIQIVVFSAVSVVLLICVRKVCMKLLKNDHEKTNIDSVVGTVCKLLKDITEDSNGEIKVNDVVWTVVSSNGESIKAGEKVKIDGIKGNKFLVSLAPKSETADDKKSKAETNK